jgi:type II secretory pathway component PulF
MPFYRYRARDKVGELVTGLMGADSESVIAVRLKQMGYLPISIKKAGEEAKINIFDKFKKVRFSELNMFTRQLFTLQKAGLSITSSLDALKEQSTNKILKSAIGQITTDIKGGLSLSSAMEKHPKIFNTLYVSMIKSGEVSGRLDQTLERLAILGEAEEKTRMRIKSATRYPIIVVTAIVAGVLFVTTAVIPRFAKLYSQFRVTLPLPTRILLGINYLVTRYWWLLLIAVVTFVGALNRFIRTKMGRIWWDRLKLKVPVFGPLVLKATISRFARITATLLESGIPILNILALTSDGVGNVVVSRAIDNIKNSVNEGRGMVEPMRLSGLFPPVVVQMVAVGEETGKIDELLLHVADYYDSEVDYTIDNLISLIEPILIFTLGGMVLLMALGVFLPIWNMVYLFKR